MNTRTTQLEALNRLLHIMDELREQCPWDKKQTIESLRTLTIEEVYELGDAILDKNYAEIKNELGDLLMHIVFYSKIGSETNVFDIADVANAVCDKLIFRHPHIYSDVKVKTEEEVKGNWEKLKLKEGKISVLSGVPKSLPALVKATRIQEKARGVGFDWDDENEVWQKVLEELEEFKQEENINNAKAMQDEFGDLLFSLINYARFKGIDPEEALERTNKKFIERFQYIEQQAIENNTKIDQLDLDMMNKYWEESKTLKKK